MYRKKELSFVLLPASLCLIILVILSNQAKAAYPTASVSPQYTDPYRHLSGVVAVPPSEMMRNLGEKGASVLKEWAGPLTPPVFGPNVDATLNNASNQNETTISINPNNDQIVIGSANDYRASLQPWVYRSTDGGTTWVNYQVPGTTSLFYGDPAVAFDHNSRAYFSYLGYTAICAPQGGMYVSRSTDAGATFTPPLTLALNSVGGPIAIFQDKEYVAADTNPASPYSSNVYIAWTQYVFQSGANCGTSTSQIAAPVVVSRSTDQGISWTSPITASQPFSSNNSAALPVIGRHGEVYLYYVGAATQQQLNYDSVLFSRSTDGGVTFPYFTHISNMVDLPSPLPNTNFRDNGFGAMAADQQVDGYLYAVWADYRTGDADIMLSRSTDNGTTWGAPVRLNDDPVGNHKDQFFPWIASAPDGYIHVSWFDRREDAANHDYKEYFTYSSDHGATWAANVAVSSAASNPGTSTFIGDYSGIAASTGVVMPMWTDIRTGGNQNGYVARGVYTAEPQGTGTPTVVSSPTVANTATATNTATSTSTSTGTNTPTVTETPTTAATHTSTPQPTSTVCPIQFTDVPPGSTFYDFIRCLACRGIINGYSDGTFKPNNNVTRGQLSKIVSNSAGFTDPQTTQMFQDVPVGSTFFDYIGRLASRGYISGYTCGGPGEPCVPPDNLPYFRPNANATRGQISKIVSNAAGFTDPIPTGQQTFQDVPPGSTFYDFVERLASRGVMGGYACGSVPSEPCVPPENRPYFRPNNNATRGQTSKIVANTFFPACSTPRR